MTTARLPLVVLLLLGACGRRAQQGPAIEPAARPPVVVDVLAVVDAPAVTDDARPAAADTPMPAADTSEPPSPDVALLRGLADGSAPLAAHVDPAHGVVLVTYLEASPNGRTPMRRSSRRLCGAAIARDAALSARIRDAVARAAEGDGFQCSADECLAPGMEYQPAYRLRFGRAADGARVLLGAFELSEAALDGSWLERMRAYVDQGLAAARARPCPR